MDNSSSQAEIKENKQESSKYLQLIRKTSTGQYFFITPKTKSNSIESSTTGQV